MKSKQNNQVHGFHRVDPNPWPMIVALGTLTLTYGTALYMHGYACGSFPYKFGLSLILLTICTWWRDVSTEGQHTASVRDGLKLGMLLFIVPEITFFFAFSWTFYYWGFNPSIPIESVWPPVFLNTLGPCKVPLLNTLILLTSGASVTWAHHSILLGSKFYACLGLIITITLATIFTSLQYLEYVTATSNISDSVYGATFYMATGFHGFHVFIGTCFLLVCFSRLYLNQFTTSHHFGFEAAAWYWHFLDVVWLFLFTTVYWWGS